MKKNNKICFISLWFGDIKVENYRFRSEKDMYLYVYYQAYRIIPLILNYIELFFCQINYKFFYNVM